MGQKLQNRIETWKKLLLDFGKRNRLINFLETKRGNVRIIMPSFEEMYEDVVINEKTLVFPCSKYVSYKEYLSKSEQYQKYKLVKYLKSKKKVNNEEIEEITDVILEVSGNIYTDRQVTDLELTLKNLRYKANTAIEEQGINTLFLTFGMLRWYEQDSSNKTLLSPLILVPVKLSIESLTSPYKLSLHEDEIVVNPTLIHKLEQDFGILIPEFDSTKDSLDDFLEEVLKKVNNKGWSVDKSIYLTNLSFLKINMYKDLERNEEALNSNPIISSLAGELDSVHISEELNNFDHDKQIRPIDTFQVLDADSSQQDAVLLSKKGISFVLQGPPGTGKSQTIANIIAEAIADGKKILFVSEKMAALQVVYNRLTNVGLSDFCFTLHSHKAKKTEILSELDKSTKFEKARVKDEALNQLYILERKREELNKYQEELHTLTSGLNISIYTVNGRLSKLKNVPDIIFPIDSADTMTETQLNEKIYLLNEFARTVEKRSEDYSKNAWRNSSVRKLTNELRHDIDSYLSTLINDFNEVKEKLKEYCDALEIDVKPTIKGFEFLLNLLSFVSESPIIPVEWIYNEDLKLLKSDIHKFKDKTLKILDGNSELLKIYKDELLNIDGANVHSILSKKSKYFQLLFKYDNINKLIENIDDIVLKIENEIDKISKIFQCGLNLSKELGLQEATSLNKLVSLYNVVILLKESLYVTKQWFDSNEFSSIQNNLSTDKKNHNDILDLLNKIKSIYGEELIEYDCRDIYKKIDNNYIQFLNHFSIDKVNVSYNESLSTLDSLCSKLRILNDKIGTVEDIACRISSTLSIDVPSTLNDVKDIIGFTEALLKDIKPCDNWFNRSEYKSIKSSLNDIIKRHNDILEYRNKIYDVFDKEILSFDSYPMLKRFRSDYNSMIKRFFSHKYKKDMAELKRYSKSGKDLSYETALQYLSLIKDYKDKVSCLNASKYSSDFGVYYFGIDTDWQKLIDALDCFDKLLLYKNILTDKCKNVLTNSDVDYDLLSKEVEHYNQLGLFDSICEINTYLANNISDTMRLSDIREITMSFANDLPIFINEIRSGINAIKTFAIKESNLSIDGYFALIKNVYKVQGMTKNISQDNEKYISRYGLYYKGIHSDWEQIERAINVFKELNKRCGQIPNDIKDKLIKNDLSIDSIKDFISLYENSDVENIYQDLKKLMPSKVEGHTDYYYLSSECKTLRENLDEFNCIYKYVCSLRKEGGNFNSILNEIEYLSELQIEECYLKKAEIKFRLGDFYDGINTDWDKLFKALHFASELQSKYNSLPKRFVEKVCSDKEFVNDCINRTENLKKIKSNYDKPYNWFKSLFDEEIFDNYAIDGLIERLTICKNKKHLLEEWVDYCSNREKCNKNGLSSYINIIEQKHIDGYHIVDAYLKRFYNLWLDAVLPNFEAVQNFRGSIHKQTIDDFCRLDQYQFKIAQSRIRVKTLDRMPDFNSINGAHGEMAILKRELSKKRKIMPLRKLFKEIPNLLTSLRPCFMMSPLSVSVFLEANRYKFDMVIFDEASQVHTEDAIGAIMRGKQVIIVGDTKQLPPTNFFTTSLNDEDFDIDNDENVDDDAGSYESILDESVTILPERSLRWHYRSRHEHLIAFSNAKVYNNQLITFPSSIEKAQDCGVEYIYVKNGIYERKGKKINRAEANKIADLVFEHFAKHPNRSLGVVTFSESQQNAVDTAIREKRLKNPSFDKFFLEDNDEPFFVKNLENVQGDERDTIIFSIGYAKDNNGVMYMNFGPLNREGGYRRLNVAITRAKYNVKLVGSIVPTDIDLERTSSEGVKLLRSYIEFAQQGIVALENEIKSNNVIELESPFEESVYDFLQSKGYDVVTQVGCSGYRIDMAIKHPNQSGKFAIGIECDGATYHSSRTARERDRLRQAVLEDMGWTIYRIWSTDWIKDRETEEEKLLDAIEKSLNYIIIDDDKRCEGDASSTIPEIVEIEEKIEQSEIIHNNYNFDFYNRYQLNNYLIYSINERLETILNIISVEQPIHFEDLCKRICPIFGRQKITSVVREEMQYIVDRYLKDDVVIDDKQFVKFKDFVDIKVRIPNPKDDYIRPISYICDDELALAMKTIVKYSFGITSEDLFIITAREFGFKRTGDNISCLLHEVYEKMLRNKEIFVIDGKLNINVSTMDSDSKQDIDMNEMLNKIRKNILDKHGIRLNDNPENTIATINLSFKFD